MFEWGVPQVRSFALSRLENVEFRCFFVREGGKRSVGKDSYYGYYFCVIVFFFSLERATGDFFISFIAIIIIIIIIISSDAGGYCFCCSCRRAVCHRSFLVVLFVEVAIAKKLTESGRPWIHHGEEFFHAFGEFGR